MMKRQLANWNDDFLIPYAPAIHANLEKACKKLSKVNTMGGKVFKGTVPVNQSAVEKIVALIDQLCAHMHTQLYVIGSCWQMLPETTAGDIDALVDARALLKYFSVKDQRKARKLFENYFKELGFETALSGSTVHVKVPYAQCYHQLDMMFVDYPAEIAQFHRHQLPVASPYKGVHKQLALFWLARNNGLCWSAFQGLYTRDRDNRKDRLLTVDADNVAYVLLGDSATAADLCCFESIVAALDTITADRMQKELILDTAWVN
jgi:hypothetical protein